MIHSIAAAMYERAHPGSKFTDAHPVAQADYEAMARAGIERARDPNETLLTAGSVSFSEWSISTHDDRGHIDPEFVVHPWQAMIDSILLHRDRRPEGSEGNG